MEIGPYGDLYKRGLENGQKDIVRTLSLFGGHYVVRNMGLEKIDMEPTKSLMGHVETIEDLYVHDYFSTEIAAALCSDIFSKTIFNMTLYMSNVASVFTIPTRSLKTLTVLNSYGSKDKAYPIRNENFGVIKSLVEQNSDMVVFNADKLTSQQSSLVIELIQSRREFEFNYGDEKSLGKYFHKKNGAITLVADSWEQLLTVGLGIGMDVAVIHIVAETESVFDFKYSFLSRRSGHTLQFSSTKNIDTIAGFVSLSKYMTKSKWDIISLQSSHDYSNPASCIEIGEKLKQLTENIVYVGRVDIRFPNKPGSPLPLSLHARLICGNHDGNSYKVDLKTNTVKCFIRRKGVLQIVEVPYIE